MWHLIRSPQICLKFSARWVKTKKWIVSEWANVKSVFFFTCLSHRVTQEDLSSAVGDLKASCPGESAVPTHISLGFTQEWGITPGGSTGLWTIIHKNYIQRWEPMWKNLQDSKDNLWQHKSSCYKCLTCDSGPNNVKYSFCCVKTKKWILNNFDTKVFSTSDVMIWGQMW